MSGKRASGGERPKVLFNEPRATPEEQAEDADTTRQVTRFQAGDREAFAVLYERYFERVYGYLRVALKDVHEAEDVTQQVFTQVFEKLPGYEQRSKPFRAWLFVVTRNHALNFLRKHHRIEVVEPAEIDRRREGPIDEEAEALALQWLNDSDLLVLVERLPLPQRQVLVLRFLLGFDTKQIARTLGRNEADVRGLQFRGLTFLRKRLNALGRIGESGELIRMRGRFKQAPVLRHRRFSLKP